jgi:hypothetical protein
MSMSREPVDAVQTDKYFFNEYFDSSAPLSFVFLCGILGCVLFSAPKKKGKRREKE